MQSVGRSSGDPIASLTRQAATEPRTKRLPRLFTPIAAALSLNHCTGHRHSDPVSDGGADNAYHKRFDGAVTLSGLELPSPLDHPEEIARPARATAAVAQQPFALVAVQMMRADPATSARHLSPIVRL